MIGKPDKDKRYEDRNSVKRSSVKSRLAGVGYGALLTGFTLYLLLDTFVLSSAYQTNASQMNLAVFEQAAVPESETVAENAYRNSGSDTLSYEDENVSITISEYVEEDTHIYVADVVVTSAEYLKTAFADDIYGKNITDTTSAIASEHDAILAVNGDFYGTQESGYVIRNGVVYRDSSNGNEILCIYADGSMKVLDSEEYTAQELVDQGVWQAWSFGPGLIEQGEIAVSETEEVGKAKASNPRTAIGMIDENHYVFVVSDGRTEESEGLSLYELAAFMQNLGVATAYNLDGGGSSTMVFQGELVNQPVSGRSNSERKVSDIVYIG